MGMAIRCFLQLISSIILMGSVAPLLLPPLVIIMLGFYLLFLYYQVYPQGQPTDMHPLDSYRVFVWFVCIYATSFSIDA